MAETGSQAGSDGQPLYSNLEVIQPQDYGRVAFNKNDKVAFVPCSNCEKLVVPPEPCDGAHHGQGHSDLWSPLTGLGHSGSVWDGHAQASGGDAGPEKRERILGLKRRVFFAILALGALLVALGVGIGAGVGISTRTHSDNNNNNNTAAGSQSAAPQNASSTPSPTPQHTANTSSSAPQNTATASPQVGYESGRCTDGWGIDCICLDANACNSTWNGRSTTGRKPDWPCPNAPVAIRACYIQPCLGASQPTSRCEWSEGCAERDLGNGTAPICPGGKDFFCCAKLVSA